MYLTDDAPIGPIHDSRKLSEYALVLKALGVSHGLSHREDGFYLLVPQRSEARVRGALLDYDRENRDWPPRPARRERLGFEGTRLPLVWAAILTALFLLSGPVASNASRSPWFAAGVASSERILHGEVFRAVTALTLHADAAHLLGNVLCGGTFLWAASRRLGAGRAAALTLAGGTLGNLANALAHPSGHNSIGASTAVFATVGLLVATQARANAQLGARKWTDRAGPIVGGVALLGVLGASAESDLWAHLFGLASGALLGFIFARAPREGASPRRWAQPALAIGSALAVAGAWAIGFAVTRARPF